jgi:hypothetical protein
MVVMVFPGVQRYQRNLMPRINQPSDGIIYHNGIASILRKWYAMG